MRYAIRYINGVAVESCCGDMEIKEGFVEVDATTYENDTRIPPLPNAAIDAQIATLEGSTERGIREGMLFLLVSEAARLGMTEPQLYTSNLGYRKAKDKDTAIAALRAQRV